MNQSKKSKSGWDRRSFRDFDFKIKVWQIHARRLNMNAWELLHRLWIYPGFLLKSTCESFFPSAPSVCASLQTLLVTSCNNIRLHVKYVGQKTFYFECLAGSVTFVICLSWHWYIDPLSANISLWVVQISGAGSAWRSGVERTVSSGRDSTMLQTKFLSAQWIPSTKPEWREVLNIIFSQLALINFSLLPSGRLECSASVTTLLFLYSTVDSRGSGHQPICYWLI